MAVGKWGITPRAKLQAKIVITEFQASRSPLYLLHRKITKEDSRAINPEPFIIITLKEKIETVSGISL